MRFPGSSVPSKRPLRHFSWLVILVGLMIAKMYLRTSCFGQLARTSIGEFGVIMDNADRPRTVKKVTSLSLVTGSLLRFVAFGGNPGVVRYRLVG